MSNQSAANSNDLPNLLKHRTNTLICFTSLKVRFIMNQRIVNVEQTKILGEKRIGRRTKHEMLSIIKSTTGVPIGWNFDSCAIPQSSCDCTQYCYNHF